MTNLNFEGEYHPWVAYAQSKTVNPYTANKLERRYSNQGLHAWSVQPGLIQTGLMQFLGEETLQGWAKDPNVANATKNPEQGADTSVWAVTSKALEGQGGKYLEDCQIAKAAKPCPKEYEPGYAPHAYDKEKEGLL